jgi:putative tryptophan/tyrosine transport system substrate-binding protein
MTTRRRLLVALGAGLIAPRIEAQPKVRRIGYLAPNPLIEPPTPERAGFLAGLRELGYDVGRNLLIEYRFGENDVDRLPDLAAELIKQRVELIVAISPEAALAVKAISTTMPIVVLSGDPLQLDLVKSYARPGGNATGMSFIAPELGAKRVALAKEIVPQARRIAVIWNARDSIANSEWSVVRGAGRTLEINLEPMPMAEADDLARSLDSLASARPDALIVLVDARIVGFRKIISDAAMRQRIPCLAGWREFVTAGALASYAPDFRALFHRLAFYVDRILRGAKPADLPVERPTKFELVLNLKTAKAIGIAIPPPVLLRADEVIQ